jgi:hypothetical protein
VQTPDQTFPGSFHQTSIAVFREVYLKQQCVQVVAEELQMSVGAARVAKSRFMHTFRNPDKGFIKD